MSQEIEKLNYSGFELCGTGSSKSDCQEFKVLGCVQEHKQTKINSKLINPIYAKGFRRNCLRMECPKCNDREIDNGKSMDVARSRAKKINKRFRQYQFKNPQMKKHWSVKHFLVSPRRQEGYANEDYKEMRKRAYELVKSIDIRGGVMIFHPFRRREQGKRYSLDNIRVSPHFHVIGYGNVKGLDTKKVYYESGWLIKNFGKRNITKTAYYLLSHCGVDKTQRKKSIVWFGDLSYRKLAINKKYIYHAYMGLDGKKTFKYIQVKQEEVKDGSLCPLCSSPLMIMTNTIAKILPYELNEGEFYLERFSENEKI